MSTGGFAPADASLAEFPDWARRAAVLGVAALGAVPLLLYYRGWRRGWRVLATYPEVRAPACRRTRCSDHNWQATAWRVER